MCQSQITEKVVNLYRLVSLLKAFASSSRGWESGERHKAIGFLKNTGMHMHRSRKFCHRGPTLRLFLVDEGWEGPNTTISHYIPLQSGHHRPTSEMPFKWCFAGMLMMAKHLMLAR